LLSVATTTVSGYRIQKKKKESTTTKIKIAYIINFTFLPVTQNLLQLFDLHVVM